MRPDGAPTFFPSNIVKFFYMLLKSKSPTKANTIAQVSTPGFDNSFVSGTLGEPWSEFRVGTVSTSIAPKLRYRRF
jgi:hypothetical protein